jgi:2-iminobutanoate/2-iminopropanoate deaminase
MSQPLVGSYKRVGDLIFTSGITGEPGDHATQVKKVFEKMKSTLSESGSSLDSVIKVNVFLSDINDRERFLNQVWKEYFPKNPPLRTTVQVGFASDVFIEIEVIARASS